MIDKTYYLIHGKVNLGLVKPIDYDFPWISGIFEPSDRYNTVSHLFWRLNELLEAEEYEEADRIYEIITQSGIYLKSLETKEYIPIHGTSIEGDRISWRWG